jgi:hypothetical protein
MGKRKTCKTRVDPVALPEAWRNRSFIPQDCNAYENFEVLMNPARQAGLGAWAVAPTARIHANRQQLNKTVRTAPPPVEIPGIEIRKLVTSG